MIIPYSRNQHLENCRIRIFLQLGAAIKSHDPAQGQNESPDQHHSRGKGHQQLTLDQFP